jgi:hypothetical protein
MGASRKVTAIVHGFVFALVWYLATEFFEIVEGFSDDNAEPDTTSEEEEDKKKK